MSLRSLFLLLVCIALVIFVGVNWDLINQPTELNLIFTELHAPLGLVLLGVMALMAALFVGNMAYTQGAVLMETRRHAKELAAQRELADKAEASRFTDLRAHLDKEMERLTQSVEAQARDTMSRIDRAEIGLRERPVEEEISRLVQAMETHNRDLHARVDRLEMGLREGLSGFVPAPASLGPAEQQRLGRSADAKASAETPDEDDPLLDPDKAGA